MQPAVLVTGATGLVGAHLLEELAPTPWLVRALVRGVAPRVSAGRLAYVEGDLLDAPSLVDACAGVDTVIHCAARLVGTAAEVTESIVRGTYNLLDAACRSGVRRFVHMSSAAVYRAGPMRHFRWSMAVLT